MCGFFVHRDEKRWRLSRGDHCREVVISRGLTLFHFFESISLQRECICCSCLIYWRWICLKCLFDMAVPWELSNNQWDSEFSFLILRTQLEIHVLTQRIISNSNFLRTVFLQSLQCISLQTKVVTELLGANSGLPVQISGHTELTLIVG